MGYQQTFINDGLDSESSFLKYPNLKKQLKQGESTKGIDIWTKENILDGLNKFFADHQRYPTSVEIDLYDFLPSSRQIQRSFGGLRSLRKDLGLKIFDYGRGANRSKIAFEGNKRGGDGEREMEQLLVNRFGEHFVHAEKTLYKYLRPGCNLRIDSKCRLDFVVYAKDYTFGVDVFYTTSLRNLMGNVNIKTKKYCDVAMDIYLVNLNETSDISAESLTKYVNNKKIKLTPNIKLLNKSDFLKIIQTTPILKVI
ncbi:MAG: hypothetical protein P4L74_01160 [Candidatus Doudnabacteria bacterium]|nr:hypothetical protein [Candidatus Doudnabacteria bacterium]